MLDLQPIKARLAAATQGPWMAGPNAPGMAAVAAVNTILVLSSGPLYGSPMQDASLIAHAPTDLTALVAEVERLREAIKAHRNDLPRSHREAELDVTPFDRRLWAVLDA